MSPTATWTKLAQEEPLKRSSVCASAVGSTVYIFGGELQARHPRDNDLHKISLSANKPEARYQTVRAGRDAPSPRVGAATTALHGKIYLFSGRGGEAMAPVDEAGRLWALDAATDTWSTVGSALPTGAGPEPRSYHCMANDGRDTLYLHAGCPEKGRCADLWAFDVSKAEWRALAPAPAPARGGASLAFADGKLYRMHGFDGAREQGGALDVFDPAVGSWGSVAFAADGVAGPGARSVSALVPVRVQGRTWLVTAFGESDPSALGHMGAGKMLADVWAYSVDDGEWALIASGDGKAPVARGWFDADRVTVDGRDGVVVVGGLGESNERLDDAWLLSFS